MKKLTTSQNLLRNLSMYLDVDSHDYDKDIIPFIKNGIILDTSIVKIFIDGLITVRFARGKDEEYQLLTQLFDLLKIKNEFKKFLITPHILTEVCTHLRKDHGGRHNYKAIFKEVAPFLAELSENEVNKNQILQRADHEKPIEIGDVSIFVVTDNFIESDVKVAILAKDWRLNAEYRDHPKVMVMDFQSICYSLV